MCTHRLPAGRPENGRRRRASPNGSPPTPMIRTGCRGLAPIAHPSCRGAATRSRMRTRRSTSAGRFCRRYVSRACRRCACACGCSSPSPSPSRAHRHPSPSAPSSPSRRGDGATASRSVQASPQQQALDQPRRARGTAAWIYSQVPMGHVRSESESVHYVPFDIWASCTPYKQYKIKVHSLKYGTSVRENLNCNIIDKYLRFGVHCDNCSINDTL